MIEFGSIFVIFALMIKEIFDDPDIITEDTTEDTKDLFTHIKHKYTRVVTQETLMDNGPIMTLNQIFSEIKELIKLDKIALLTKNAEEIKYFVNFIECPSITMDFHTGDFIISCEMICFRKLSFMKEEDDQVTV